MELPNAHWQIGAYRFGFNGKEKDDEWSGYDFGARLYDEKIARFRSIDPLSNSFPFLSPYAFAANNPIRYIDVDGKSPGDPKPLSYQSIQTRANIWIKDQVLTNYLAKGETLERARKAAMGYVMEEFYLQSIEKDPIASRYVKRGNWDYYIKDFMGIREDHDGAVPDAITYMKWVEQDETGREIGYAKLKGYIDVKTRSIISTRDIGDDQQIQLMMFAAANETAPIASTERSGPPRYVRAGDVGVASIFLVVPGDAQFAKNPITGRSFLEEDAEKYGVNVYIISMIEKNGKVGFSEPKEFYMTKKGVEDKRRSHLMSMTPSGFEFINYKTYEKGVQRFQEMRKKRKNK